MKKTIALTLAAISFSALALTACEQTTTETVRKNNEIRLWTAPSYIKVLQDIDYSTEEEYAGYYADPSLEISMYRNEKEGGQILLTPKYDVAEYTLKKAELLSATGEKIPAENIFLFNEKYVDVKVASASHSVPNLMGMVPDALLPFDKAVEYGENEIVGGNNQGIYVEIDSKGISSGKYSGQFILTADGKDYTVPVSVTVWDEDVPNSSTLKTSFILRGKELMQAELTSSIELYKNYYENLLDYRVNLERTPETWAEKNEENYIKDLRKYFDDERITSISFYDCSNESWTAYEYEMARYWFEKIALLCFEDGKNYYSKLYYYLSMIDEPGMSPERAKNVVPFMKDMARARGETVRELLENRSEYDVSDELFDSVIKGMKEFEFVVTSGYSEEFDYQYNKSTPENPDEEYLITWCPYMSAYQTENGEERNRQDGVEEWWYGCNWPGAPYPTYHIDDRLLSARALSWMAYKFDVKGNLYWGMLSARQKTEFGSNEPLEDPYDMTNTQQGTVHGDGYIVYPGKPYGLDTFVPSLRLVAIRDGMEDYEILRIAEEKGKAIAALAGYDDFDMSATYESLYKSLFFRTKMTGDSLDFTTARNTLAQFAEFAKKGTIITNVENKMLSTAITVFVQEGTLKVGGTEPTFIERAGGKEYTMEITHTAKDNYLLFTQEKDGQTSDFSMSVGGQKKSFDAQELTYGGLNKNGNTVAKNNDGTGVTVQVGVAPTEYQSIVLTGRTIEQTLRSGIKTLSFEIENAGDAYGLEFKFVGSRESIVNSVAGVWEIGNGTTIVTIDLSAFDWTTIGFIKEFRLYLTYSVMQERTITIKSMSVGY